jgi:subtilisin family serine protease
MRRFILLLSLFCTSLFAQWTDPQIRVEMADGRAQVFDVAHPPAGDLGIIVEFRDPPLCERRGVAAKAAKAEYDAAFRRFRSDIQSSSNIRYEYYELFNGVALKASPAEAAAIRQLPYVKAIHSDVEVRAFAATPPANITKIRADQVWSTLGSRGRGATVAVIDTGIDYRHPALGGCFGPGCKVIGGYDFVNRDTDPMDDHFHGTHVAGIIAGESDSLLGVAPDASLLAYKVLNQNGSGKSSDIIAAIERAADPNGDGDFSDHADVANLSLGGIGSPDDAMSLAIDRGTALGVVYCIAAGNSGSNFHTIASPGNARTAITVGASDNNDAIAFFSSRGPNTKNAALKPDVLAPGVSIVSSLPGGKYGPLSGTSMATPHIAGVAALVKSLHRDWRPDQVKSAIVDNTALLGQDIMTQGGGRVDALAAASATTIVTPGSISLGEDHLPQATWSTSATLHLTNNGTQAATYTIGTFSTSAVAIQINPSQATLDPGASTDINLTYTVTNSLVSPPTSLAFGGLITITNSATPEITRVPWAGVKAARVVLGYDKAIPTVVFIDRTLGTATQGWLIDGLNAEAFLRGGTYDTLVTYEQFDNAPLIAGSAPHLSDFRVHYLDAQQVSDDATILVNSTAATHTISLDGRNENGQAVVGDNFDGYASTGRIVLPPGNKVQSVALSGYPTRTWHVTDLTERLLIQELNYDFLDSHFYIVQYTPLEGVQGDATLTGGGSDLKRVSLTVAPAPSLAGDQRVVLFAVPLVPISDTVGSLGLAIRLTAPLFNMTLFLGPDTDPTYSMSSVISSITDFLTRFQTPPLRVLNGNIVSATSGTRLAPWSYSGDGLVFGNGVHFPRQMWIPGTTATTPSLFTDFVGQLGEVRVGEHASTLTTVFASDSSVLTSGSKYPMQLDLSHGGPFTVTAVDTSTLVPGVPRKSTVTSRLDASRPDLTPPTFTTLMLFDGKGQIATHLDSHGGGSLVFGAADFAFATNGSRTYQPIASDQTKAWFRHNGSQQWQPLTISQAGEDQTSGIVYRADLGGVANADNVLIDLRFDIADASGNTTSFVMEPAFAVGRDSFFGRRGPHH